MLYQKLFKPIYEPMKQIVIFNQVNVLQLNWYFVSKIVLTYNEKKLF